MVGNELVLIFLGHSFEWIEGSLKITFEFITGSNDFVHDLESLFFGDTWSEWVVSQVSSDSDSSGVDHSRFFLTEVSVGKLISIHIRLMLVTWLVSVVLFDNSVEDLVELFVSVVRTSIDTDSRVKVSNT